MKKFLLGLLLSTSWVAVASAADLTSGAPLPRIPGPTYSWQGFYVGATAGGAWGNYDPRTSTVIGYFTGAQVPLVAAAGFQKINPSGWTAGVETGYNWQYNNFVAGVEADFQYVGLAGNASSGAVLYPGLGLANFTVNSHGNTDGVFTLRPRIGLAANNVLFYATGGLALTDLNDRFSFTDTFGGIETANNNNTEAGYVAGGGVEIGLSPVWTIKGEYLYMNFPRTTSTSTNLSTAGIAFPGTVFTHSIDLSASIARIGVNYRF